MNNLFPKWTVVFLATSIIGFLFQQIIDPNFWYIFAFFPAFAFDYPWMFITSIFLHADISHLFFNMFALFFFGIYLERLIGHRIYIIIFFVSGVLGNVGYMITANNALVPAIGASGAIFGLIGALATLRPTMLIFIYGFIPVPMIIAAILWVFIDLTGLTSPSDIAHGAHLMGMFVGIVFGIYIRLKAKRELESYLH